MTICSIDMNIHVYAKPAGYNVTCQTTTTSRQVTWLYAVLTNQMLVYKHRQVKLSIVTPRIKNVAKMPKLNPRINLGISSDLGITNPRFIIRFINDDDDDINSHDELLFTGER